jgi:hypothetical protein
MNFDRILQIRCSVVGSFVPKLSPEHTRIEYFLPAQLPQNLPIGFRPAITLAARESGI